MPQTRQTRTGKLSDTARHLILPSGIVTTGWPSVRDTCEGFGVRFDPWQDGTGRAILSKRDDGSYAASIGGVVISIPRQVGKTFLIGALVFALCLLFPGLTVIWTAHRLRTAAETFTSMQAFAARRKVKPHVSKIVLGSGEEEIQFHNGSRILFGARERGFGRGFAKVHVLVFDEAQILTENAIDDMVPATNQAENPLLIFTGTPPKPTDPSEVFTFKRKQALDGEADDTVYIEFSADRDCDPLDRRQWSKANPSFPRRTNEGAMLRMHKNLSEDSFVREALGIWDEDVDDLELDPEVWAALDIGNEEKRPTPVAFSVEMSIDRKWVSIGMAGLRSDGSRQLEIVTSGRGTKWVADEVASLVKKWRPVGVGLFQGGPAGALISDLSAKGVEPTLLSSTDLGKATGMLLDGVAEGTIHHSSQPLLSIAVGEARTRRMGAVKVWDLRGATDIAPLQCISAALYVLATAKKRSGAVW